MPDFKPGHYPCGPLQPVRRQARICGTKWAVSGVRRPLTLAPSSKRRSATASGASTYRINGGELSWEAYSTALEDLNVLTRARNFLVFQGDVESLAGKDERALLAHLELVCGSGELKEAFEGAESDRLKPIHERLEGRHSFPRLRLFRAFWLAGRFGPVPAGRQGGGPVEDPDRSE